MNEAIKLAIENGWNAKPNSVVVMSGAFALEASFWQALGKALGWKETIDTQQGDRYDEIWTETTWFYYAHRYFDLVLTGGDTEKFWYELLTKQE